MHNFPCWIAFHHLFFLFKSGMDSLALLKRVVAARVHASGDCVRRAQEFNAGLRRVIQDPYASRSFAPFGGRTGGGAGSGGHLEGGRSPDDQHFYDDAVAKRKAHYDTLLSSPPDLLQPARSLVLPPVPPEGIMALLAAMKVAIETHTVTPETLHAARTLVSTLSTGAQYKDQAQSLLLINQMLASLEDMVKTDATPLNLGMQSVLTQAARVNSASIMLADAPASVRASALRAPRETPAEVEPETEGTTQDPVRTTQFGPMHASLNDILAGRSNLQSVNRRRNPQKQANQASVAGTIEARPTETQGTRGLPVSNVPGSAAADTALGGADAPVTSTIQSVPGGPAPVEATTEPGQGPETAPPAPSVGTAAKAGLPTTPAQLDSAATSTDEEFATDAPTTPSHGSPSETGDEDPEAAIRAHAAEITKLADKAEEQLAHPRGDAKENARSLADMVFTAQRVHSGASDLLEQAALEVPLRNNLSTTVMVGAANDVDRILTAATTAAAAAKNPVPKLPTSTGTGEYEGVVTQNAPIKAELADMQAAKALLTVGHAPSAQDDAAMQSAEAHARFAVARANIGTALFAKQAQQEKAHEATVSLEQRKLAARNRADAAPKTEASMQRTNAGGNPQTSLGITGALQPITDEPPAPSRADIIGRAVGTTAANAVGSAASAAATAASQVAAAVGAAAGTTARAAGAALGAFATQVGENVTRSRNKQPIVGDQHPGVGDQHPVAGVVGFHQVEEDNMLVEAPDHRTPIWSPALHRFLRVEELPTRQQGTEAPLQRTIRGQVPHLALHDAPGYVQNSRTAANDRLANWGSTSLAPAGAAQLQDELPSTLQVFPGPAGRAVGAAVPTQVPEQQGPTVRAQPKPLELIAPPRASGTALPPGEASGLDLMLADRNTLPGARRPAPPASAADAEAMPVSARTRGRSASMEAAAEEARKATLPKHRRAAPPVVALPTLPEGRSLPANPTLAQMASNPAQGKAVMLKFFADAQAGGAPSVKALSQLNAWLREGGQHGAQAATVTNVDKRVDILRRIDRAIAAVAARPP